jgi:hypothetical protein
VINTINNWLQNRKSICPIIEKIKIIEINIFRVIIAVDKINGIGWYVKKI